MSGKSWEDMAREVLVQGRPADIGSAALGWKELIKNVGQVKESLEQNVRDLGAVWKGPAYDAFKTHIEGIAKDAGRIIDEVDKPGSGRESIVSTLETAARQLEAAQAKMPVPQSCVGDLMAARNGELTLDTGLFETSVRADFMGSWPVEQIGKFNDWVTEWFTDNTGEARKAYDEVNGNFKERTMDTPGGNVAPDIRDPSQEIPDLGGGPGGGGAGGVPSVGGMPSTGGMGGGAPSVSAGGMPGTGSAGIGSGAHPDLSSGGYGSGTGYPGTGSYPSTGTGGLGEEYGTGLAGAGTATAPGIGSGGLPSTSGLGAGGGLGSGAAGGAGGGMIPGGGALGRAVSPMMPPMMGGAAGAGKGAGGRGGGGRLGGAGRPGAGGMMPGVGGGMAGAGRGAAGGGRGGANATAGGARGAGARGGVAGMGHGGGAGYGEEETPRNTWLDEDEDVWGADGGGTPGVLR